MKSRLLWLACMNGHEENKMSVEKDNEAVFSIRFEDLIFEARKRLLEFMHVECPTELNWDIFPITAISRDEADEKI
jgi:hypothetical protein